MSGGRPGGVQGDLDALAEVGFGPEAIDTMAYAGFEPGQFADSHALDRPVRAFVLKVLEAKATTAEYEWFESQPDSKVIAEWMLGLPSFPQGDGRRGR